MPYRSNVPCKHPGCAALIPYSQMYCDEHKQLHKNDRAWPISREMLSNGRIRKKNAGEVSITISAEIASWYYSECLNVFNVTSGLQKMTCKAVSERM